MAVTKQVLLALVVALAIGTLPALGADMDPTDRWQSQTGESRYDFFICGGNGALCAKLAWLRPDAVNKDTTPFLGKLVIDHARHTAVNRWRGTVHALGKTAEGILTLVDGKTFKLTGCVGPACGSFELHKV